MRKFMMVALLSMVALVTGCSKVPHGNVGLKVLLLGSEKGVDVIELTPGRHWIGVNEELYLFPTFAQNTEWTQDIRNGSEYDESISFQTKQGLVVNADVGMSYAIDPTKANTLFQKYRKGISEITDIYLRNMIRDSLVRRAGSLDIESVYGSGKADLLTGVEHDVREYVGPLGINIERIYWIGEIRLPPSVITAINDKIGATQKAQQRENDIQKAAADAEIKRTDAKGEADAILIRARAQAEANRLVSNSISSTLVQYNTVDKWNGELPGVTGGVIPMLNVGK